MPAVKDFWKDSYATSLFHGIQGNGLLHLLKEAWGWERQRIPIALVTGRLIGLEKLPICFSRRLSSSDEVDYDDDFERTRPILLEKERSKRC